MVSHCMKLPKGIYGITDTSYTIKNHVEAARAFLEGGGVRIVQYRRKEGSIRVMLEELGPLGGFVMSMELYLSLMIGLT